MDFLTSFNSFAATSDWKFMKDLISLPQVDLHKQTAESPKTVDEASVNQLSAEFMEMMKFRPPPIFKVQEKVENPLSIDEAEIKSLSNLLQKKEQFSKSNLSPDGVEKEISHIREVLKTNEFEGLTKATLPVPEGPVVTVMRKYYVPVKEFPGYNFVGRILGPRGQTARQFEQETGCGISLRGKGRDNRRAIASYGLQECFEDKLHVLVWCTDTSNRCQLKMNNAFGHVMKLLTPAPEEIKRKQLTKLAMLNNTYPSDYKFK